MSAITLSPALQQTLTNLGQIQGAFESVQAEVQTGQAASDATHDALAYFQSASLNSRASQILNDKSTLDQGISAVGAALAVTSGVEGLLQQLQGVLAGARGASLPARVEATSRFQAIGTQLARLVEDGSYQGLNLLSSSATAFSVPAGASGAGALTFAGYDLIDTHGASSRALFTAAGGAFNAAGSLLFSNVVASTTAGPGTVTGFSALDVIGGTNAGSVKASVADVIFSETETRLDNAINQLQTIAGALGDFSSLLQSRSSFQQNYAAELQAGAAKLTLADLNQSAAQSEASSLRVELGLQSALLQGEIRSTILQILHAPSGSA